MRQRKDWEDLRVDIENIVRENNIAPSDFKTLSIHYVIKPARAGFKFQLTWLYLLRTGSFRT
jgi:hypothetical protein